MLTHIVMWKYHADVPEETREEHRNRLRKLPAILSVEIKSFSVGADILKLTRSYDTGLVAIFPDQAALEAYTIAPEHVAVANFSRGIAQHIVSVDFED